MSESNISLLQVDQQRIGIVQNNIFGIQSAQNRNRNKSAPYYEYVTDIIKNART